jgi:hypothetical protein
VTAVPGVIGVQFVVAEELRVRVAEELEHAGISSARFSAKNGKPSGVLADYRQVLFSAETGFWLD